jgi:3-isopropylmalate/(R)-2-methylmalate dehydratase small subunit
MTIRGKAWKFGDDVDTDLIIPARYLNTTDIAELSKHCLEPVNPEWAGRVAAGDVIVAGKNFGCGSSREHAPLAIKGVGVAAIVAVSFARIFYRNAFNIGLPVIEAPEAAAAIAEGDELEIFLDEGKIAAGGRSFPFAPIPDFMMDLVRAGGLMPWLKEEIGSGGNKS